MLSLPFSESSQVYSCHEIIFHGTLTEPSRFASQETSNLRQLQENCLVSKEIQYNKILLCVFVCIDVVIEQERNHHHLDGTEPPTSRLNYFS